MRAGGGPRFTAGGSTAIPGYTILGEIRCGGQGVVFLTERRGADGFTLPIALKIFSPERYNDARAYDDAMALEMLAREGRLDRAEHAYQRLDQSLTNLIPALQANNQNDPKEPYTEDTSPVVKVKAPVLLVHGQNDAALLPGMLNRTWEWLDNTLTLVTIPGVGHFVQNDAPDLVSSTMSSWLQLPLK